MRAFGKCLATLATATAPRRDPSQEMDGFSQKPPRRLFAHVPSSSHENSRPARCDRKCPGEFRRDKYSRAAAAKHNCSIGSNDLTQLILGVDRDSEIVAPIFDAWNPAVKKMIADVIAVCRAKGRKIGICGPAPSDYPEFAQFLVAQKIDSISLNPDSVLKTTMAILEKE